MRRIKNYLIINFIIICLSFLSISIALADYRPSSHRSLVQSTQGHDISSSQYLEVQLRAVLATNPVLEYYNIKADVSKEKARLSGQVRNNDEKQLAEVIAKSIPGIKEVDNNIIINESFKPGSSPSWVNAIIDATATAMIKSAFLLNPIINMRNINVTTANGVVTLTGKARSEEEIIDAENMAIHIPGVITVKNHLSIEPYDPSQ